MEAIVAKKREPKPRPASAPAVPSEAYDREDTDILRLFLSDLTKLDMLKAARRDKSVAVTFRALLTEALDAAFLAMTGVDPDQVRKVRG